MKKVIGIVLAFVLALTVVLTSVGCNSVSGSGSTKLQYSDMVEEFIKNNLTYKFDGIVGSVKVLRSTVSDNGATEFTIEYQTAQPGHGDRSEQVLAQVITTHKATITVKDGIIASAVCDGNRDMLKSDTGSGQELTLPVGQTPDVPVEDLANK